MEIFDLAYYLSQKKATELQLAPGTVPRLLVAGSPVPLDLPVLDFEAIIEFAGKLLGEAERAELEALRQCDLQCGFGKGAHVRIVVAPAGARFILHMPAQPEPDEFAGLDELLAGMQTDH